MGKRLNTNFYSLDGDYYEVDIYDSSYSSSVIDFNAADEGFRLSYNADDNDRNAPIIGSSCTLRMRVANSDHESFLDDLVGSAEMRFVLQVSKNSSRWWTGVILADQIEIDDMVVDGHPYFFDITATDGLARLKDIDYNDGGAAYTGWASMREHLYNCLEKIGLDSFYSSGYYFQHITDWMEDSHAAGADPLENTRFHHKALISINKKGDISYRNAYEVLEQIARIWNARIYQAAGCYWMTQLNAMDEATSTVHAYTQAGAYTKRTGVDTREFCYTEATPAGELFIKSGGRFSFLAPVKSAVVNYRHYDAQNYAAGEDVLSGFTLTDVRSNGNTATLLVDLILEATVNFSDPANFEPAYAVYRMTIQHGGFYLRRDVNWYDTGFSYGETQWDATGAQYYYIVLGPYNYNQQTITEHISLETDELETDADMTFGLVLYEVRALATSNVRDGGLYSAIDRTYNLFVEILQDGTVEDQVNIDTYESTNTDTDNTLKIEVEAWTGDGPTENSIARLQVNDGADWVDADGWRRAGVGSYTTFGKLLATEILEGQEVPIRRFRGTKFGPFEMYQHAQRGTSTYFIFHSGTFTARYDEWDGAWVQITHPGLRTAVQGTVRYWDKDKFIRIPAVDEAPSRQVGQPTRSLTNPVNPGTAETTIEGISITKIATPIVEAVDVSTIDITAIGTPGIIRSGDVLVLVDPSTGASERATVTADVGASDTSISVTTFTPSYDLSNGSYIFKDPVQAAAAGAPIVEYFDSHSSSTITAANTILRVDRLVENGIELSEGAGRDFTFSGADVTLNYTPIGSNFKLVYYAS